MNEELENGKAKDKMSGDMKNTYLSVLWIKFQC